MFYAITAVALSGLLSLNPTVILNNEQTKTSEVEQTAQVKDERAIQLDTYFAKWNMPLNGYGAKFVEEADKYNLDWRLLPAIAVAESSGGKYMKNNNPFGWASCEVAFNDFNHAIEIVAWNLAGGNPETAKYYKDADIDTILWYYNGSVIKTYPNKIKYIMTLFEA